MKGRRPVGRHVKRRDSSGDAIDDVVGSISPRVQGDRPEMIVHARPQTPDGSPVMRPGELPFNSRRVMKVLDVAGRQTEFAD